ncbi:MAG: methyltransferase domain-containing protein, partial [Actinobacteria bacterium]|nr:methyltransferase domain-containing protein [Actinomycetota bacterium]
MIIMANNFRYVDSCRLCTSTDLENVLTLKPSPLGDQYLPKGGSAKAANLIPFGVSRCNACNNFQTETAVDREHYTHCLTRPAAVNKVLSKSYRDSVPRLIEMVNLAPEDLVLEIGSNDGNFASAFVEMGFRCLGVDPALNLVESAEKRGVPTLVEFFDSKLGHEIISKHGKAKVVIANFVVANVDDLDDFMVGVVEVLATDGVLTIETNYVTDIVSELLVETLVHEHLSYLSVTALTVFLDRHGLELFDVQRISSKGGSIRCLVQHKGGKIKVGQSVSDAKAFELSSGLFLSSSWGKLSSAFAHARISAIKFCEQKFTDGIVGYGTSDGATIFIYQLGIGEYVEALIDDDPYRQNLESPGFGIPTVSREAIFTDPLMAKTCLIFAPQYVKQIIDKNSSARESGVTFAKVWPLIEVFSESG